MLRRLFRKNRSLPREIALPLLLLICFSIPSAGRAGGTRATPSGFAYGARLEATGDHLETAVGLAARLGLQWLAVTLDWSQTWPAPAETPDLSGLAPAMALAQASGIPVLVSVTHAPDWALDPTGPNPGQTTRLILELTRRYPPVQAIELFPGANTTQGWGAAPDPGRYLALLQQVQAGTAEIDRPLQWIAGGLTPLPAGHSPADLDDLAFLDGLYAHGGAESLSVVSLRFGDITGAPMTSPFGPETRVLRRYEALREMMLKHGHKNGMLWVTSFTWPSGKISPDDTGYEKPDAQAIWLHQAYHQLSSQLYIGVAFFNGLNPARGEQPGGIEGRSLIGERGNLHPGLWNIGQLISFTTDLETLNSQGLVSFKKIHFDKNRFKPFL